MVNRVPPFKNNHDIPKYEVFSKKISLLIHLSQVALMGFASYSTPCKLHSKSHIGFIKT
jgi:hypothetical protein